MKLFIMFSLMACQMTITAQDVTLLEPLNFQHAVREGTRTRDGNPGPDYWQNHADYNISVKLDTAVKKIWGEEEVTYYNLSPDTLTHIVLRLYKNRYKSGAIRDQIVHPGNVHEGMELDTICINGKGIHPDDPGIMVNGTNLAVSLENPLLPGSKLNLSCAWNYSLPLEPEFRRTGYYRDNAWFVGYFYPQVAVYDDMEFSPAMGGWDYTLFHKGMQEFYNDFNNYQVTIEVPEGFYVWGTGTLTNAEEVYAESLLERLETARTSDEIHGIITREELGKDLLVGNRWHFEAKSVPDFGFGTARDYLWDGTSVTVGDRRVFVDVAYHPESILYPQVIHIARNTVEYTSEMFPGVHYPYEHSTTFNGMLAGGMEFPMIANNSDDMDTMFLTLMSFHEIAHNYFPFMMGINEKRYHFLDEGLTEYFSVQYLWDEHKMDFYNPGSESDHPDGIYRSYSDLCISTQDNTSIYNAFAYIDNHNVFFQYMVKSVVPYMLFADMVGETRFQTALREFVRRWQGKHPTPFDLFYTMNDVLQENYNWFWNAWFMDFGYPDLGVEIRDGQVIVSRMGTRALPLPVHLKIEYTDGTTTTLSRSMDIWKNGEESLALEIENAEKISSVTLNKGNAPDIDRSNNYIKL